MSPNPFDQLSVDGFPAGPAASAPSSASPAPAAPAKRGRVVLRREKAHRGGKTVIVVDQFPPAVSAAAIDELARQLKRACGCGGTVRERTIEVQGDQPGKIRALLEAEGFQVAGER